MLTLISLSLVLLQRHLSLNPQRLQAHGSSRVVDQAI